MKSSCRFLLVGLALASAACGTSSDPGHETTTASDGGAPPPTSSSTSTSTSTPPPPPPAPKTCGAGLPTKCADGEPCQTDLDCAGDYCGAGGTCEAAPADVHQDGRRDGGETGVDCGGTATATCGGGQGCTTSDDCQGLCNGGTCDAPSATDGKKNQDESDVDCGGTNAPKCVRTKACTTNADCLLDDCVASVCATPTATDQVKNGGESDVDCGGAGVTEGAFTYLPPRCKDIHACSVDADCVSGACAPTGQCVPKSCDTAETSGITSCGTKEVDDGAKVHETCCKSLKLPNRNARLDKYEITAGRFRTFLAAVGPDIRAWVTSYAAANPSSQLKDLLTKGPVVTSLLPAVKTGAPMNLVAHMSFDIDNYGGIRGCYNGNGDYAHNTYWQPKDDLAEYGIPERPLARTVTDVKSLNCAMPMMFMAFCAWDGGQLATAADYTDAWGGAAYPWGASPVPATNGKPNSPNYNWCNGTPGTGNFNCQNTSLGSNGNFYMWPVVTDNVLMLDRSPWIGAPGRFPLDATSRQANGESWLDVFANMVEYTGDITASATQDFCDFSAAPLPGATTCTRNGKLDYSVNPPVPLVGTKYVGVPKVGLVGRSWEGHIYDMGSLTNAYPVTFQYGKFGGRCVRPVQ